MINEIKPITSYHVLNPINPYDNEHAKIVYPEPPEPPKCRKIHEGTFLDAIFVAMLFGFMIGLGFGMIISKII